MPCLRLLSAGLNVPSASREIRMSLDLDASISIELDAAEEDFFCSFDADFRHGFVVLELPLLGLRVDVFGSALLDPLISHAMGGT